MNTGAVDTIDMRDLYGFTEDQLYTGSHPENQAIRGAPHDKWPATFSIAWDYSPQHFHRALDGESASDFSDDYSHVLIGEANLAEIDGELHGSSRRKKSELWLNSQDKVARCILYWCNGLLITPPMLAVNMGKLVIVGGNNRMAVCRAADLARLPFLFSAEHQVMLAAKLPSFTVIQADCQPSQRADHE
ncbi:hypothetical protein [Pseudomonas sp. UMAB-40]|uniref:hypothetical protein n=1 Tax=Pseudomonas sp. UMAB-40 TaxID=1365407 RepID=UPI001C592158|nr:hypothetical protein [Pseudomonas sp. UMAB-40]